MPAWYAKLMGRHTVAKVDHEIAATPAAYQVGAMQVYPLRPVVIANVVAISTGWVCRVQGDVAAPLLLKRIEINNHEASPNYVSLGIMTVNDGTPSTSNAFIAWNTIIAPYETWEWTGEVPLIDRYVYVKGTSLGMTMFYQAEELDR